VASQKDAVQREQPHLCLVPTPIGNLEDITLRALRVLKEADVILAEDTRTSGRLLKHYEVATPMRAFHAHNEHKTTEQLVQQMADGQRMALITDAGTPGISDPGFLLVRAVLQAELTVETLPGATAFVPALVNSGLPTDKFVFEGFLPHKKGRQTRIQQLAEESRTIVFYESPYRLVKTLGQLKEVFGEDRQAAVSRELSKLFEETQRGTLQELEQHFGQKAVKGEIVLVVQGKVNF
jgi:16S rRNA (cytidine1402-2'-O)-methyltransferase